MLRLGAITEAKVVDGAKNGGPRGNLSAERHMHNYRQRKIK